jgi:hypothetical protein
MMICPASELDLRSNARDLDEPSAMPLCFPRLNRLSHVWLCLLLTDQSGNTERPESAVSWWALSGLALYASFGPRGTRPVPLQHGQTTSAMRSNSAFTAPVPAASRMMVGSFSVPSVFHTM